jgi:hypothetical protein
MKNRFEAYFVFLAFLGVFLLTMCSQNLLAQDGEKNRIRISANYFKIMDGEAYFDIKASARIEKKNTEVPNVKLTVFNEFNDEEIELGTVTTNMNGEGKFVLPKLNEITPDSTHTYNFVVSFDGNESFKRASRSVSIKDVDIKAELVVKDSTNYIKATLIDVSKDSLLIGESMDVQVQRLFMPHKIGEEFNFTDENGTILVPVDKDIPGIDGNLTIEVVLNDHDIYGTVKDLVVAPIGTPIVDESTFDQRKMWSPRNKTPLFLLIFPNLLIFGIWGLIIYLITNLFKIAKS